MQEEDKSKGDFDLYNGHYTEMAIDYWMEYSTQRLLSEALNVGGSYISTIRLTTRILREKSAKGLLTSTDIAQYCDNIDNRILKIENLISLIKKRFDAENE